MKGYRILASLCLASGVVLGGLTLGLVRLAPERGAVVEELDPAAGEAARVFLDAAARGDLLQAGDCLLGAPQLTAPAENEQDAAWLLWAYYYAHITAVPQGQPYAAQGIRQDAVFTVPDLARVTERMGQLVPQILAERVESAEDVSEIYDETNGYRKELTDWVLLEAARRATAEPAVLKEKRLALSLVYADGRWYVRPDQSVMDILSGSLEKG